MEDDFVLITKNDLAERPFAGPDALEEADVEHTLEPSQRLKRKRSSEVGSATNRAEEVSSALKRDRHTQTPYVDLPVAKQPWVSDELQSSSAVFKFLSSIHQHRVIARVFGPALCEQLSSQSVR